MVPHDERVAAFQLRPVPAPQHFQLSAYAKMMEVIQPCSPKPPWLLHCRGQIGRPETNCVRPVPVDPLSASVARRHTTESHRITVTCRRRRRSDARCGQLRPAGTTSTLISAPIRTRLAWSFFTNRLPKVFSSCPVEARLSALLAAPKPQPQPAAEPQLLQPHSVPFRSEHPIFSSLTR